MPQRNRSTRHPKTTQGSALVRQSSEKTRLHTELGEAHRADQRSCSALDAHFREACIAHHTPGSIGHVTVLIKYVIGAESMAVPAALLVRLLAVSTTRLISRSNLAACQASHLQARRFIHVDRT